MNREEQIAERRKQNQMETHHKNGNGLDNRRANLCAVTTKEHCALHRLKPMCGLIKGDVQGRFKPKTSPNLFAGVGEQAIIINRG